MDCDLKFQSDMADWRAVSFATKYVLVADDPARMRSVGAAGIDPSLRGHVVDKLPRRLRDGYTDADRRQLQRLRKGQLFVLSDPTTGAPARDDEGKLILLEAASGPEPLPGVRSMVSWRSDSGVRLSYGGDAGQMFAALKSAFPEVNVLRLDFNAATLDNPGLAESWRSFAAAAADRGYRLVVQYSDGWLAGGFFGEGTARQRYLTLDQLGPADALDQPRGDWKINRLRADWERSLRWFREPAQAAILDAVAGWELINEPMAYGNKPAGAALYGRHMADLIQSLDWGSQRILVGGLNASAQFARLDLDLIRNAAGDRLVWSVHMYPGWVTAAFPQSSGNTFRAELCGRIGMLDKPGDDILVTETQLHTAAGSLSPRGGRQAANSFNMARKLPWLSDHGIGWTWWPPTARKSDLLNWNGGDRGWTVELESAAFAHWGWTRTMTEPRQDGQEWGTPGNDHAGPAQVSDVTNSHGLFFGLGGDDVLNGGAGVDLLYGGPGADSMTGGAGDDWLFGSQDADRIEGGDGDDAVIDPEGTNGLSGGDGNDHVEGSGTLDGGTGDDTLIGSYQGDDVLTGGAGRDAFLPDRAGKTRVTDFTSGEDVLDLTMLTGGRSCPTKLTLIRAESRSRLTDESGTVVDLPGATLGQQDVTGLGTCRLTEEDVATSDG